MTKTINEAIEWIHGRLKFGSRPGLDRIEAILTLLDNPEKKLLVIHVAGTNGKGSTVSCLQAMIHETGLKVGTFTSPYIESFNERIAINGQPITDEELIKLVAKIKPLAEELDKKAATAGITEFEVLTAMGFDYFLKEKVDVAIIEVGLGGKWDCTNVVSPMLTAITTIGMDHMDILGDTLEEIAAQKAGIIKPKIQLVCGNISEEALAVIDQEAVQNQAPVTHFGEGFKVEYHHPDAVWGEVFDFYNEAGKISNLVTPLLGKHQVENSGVAVQLFYQYCQLMKLPFQEKVVRQGLKKTHWPARMERLRSEPLIVLDGAHNDHAIKRLVENLQSEFKDYRIHILFSALETKDIRGMLALLLEVANAELYVTSFDYPKALDLSKGYQLENEKRIKIIDLWQAGLADLMEQAQSDDLILITGSLYFVSQVRQLLKDI